MDDIAAAMKVSKKAHKAQTDKAGAPYWKHPRRVAELAVDLCFEVSICSLDRPVVACAALLHDVVEDTPVTAKDLFDQGFSALCVATVELLTKPVDASDLSDYYAKIADDYLARTIKLADIADNSNEQRMANLTDENRERLTAKYEKALIALGITDEERAWLAAARKLPVPRKV